MLVLRKCPACGKPASPRGEGSPFPFCSERCRLLDLGKWLDEDYRIPAGLAGDGAAGSADRDAEAEPDSAPPGRRGA